MAKLYKRDQSPYYYARVKMWDEMKQVWRWKGFNTKERDEDRALLVANQIENTAKTVAGIKESTITRKEVESLIMPIIVAKGLTISDEVNAPFVRDMINKYMDTQREIVKERSYNTYKTAMNAFLKWLDKQPNKNPKADQISVDLASEYYHDMLKVCSPRSSKDRVKYMDRVYGMYCDREIIAKNPFKAVKFTNKTNEDYDNELERIPFSSDDVKKLLGFLREDWLKAFIVSLQTGARLEDCVTMRKDNIDGGILKYKQEKTGKLIECPLVNEEWTKLLLSGNSEYICPTLHSEFLKNGNSRLSGMFTKLVSEAGVKQEYKTFVSGRKIARKTFHSIRHTLRSEIINSGGTSSQADMILGHSEGMGRRYTHMDIEAMREALNKAISVKT